MAVAAVTLVAADITKLRRADTLKNSSSDFVALSSTMCPAGQPLYGLARFGMRMS